MNTLFSFIFVICAFLMLLHNPDTFLAAVIDGGAKAASTCVALVATYAVWMGLIRVWEECGISRKFAKFVKPVARKLLKTTDNEALEAISMNLSVNLLGISGAATPYGMKAATLLDKTENAEFSSALFFVLNATSLQLLPTSMVAVRTSLASAAPADIILPTMITTIFSTSLGVILTYLLLRPKKQASRNTFLLDASQPIAKTSRAGMR